MNSIPFQFLRVSIPVFMKKKKLIDIKSESIYGIFYHSAMWITVIWSIYLNPLSSDLHQFLNIFVRPIVYIFDSEKHRSEKLKKKNFQFGN